MSSGEKILENLEKNGYNGTLLITGPLNEKKKQRIEAFSGNILYNTKKVPTDSQALVKELIGSNEHEDFILFKNGPIKIGAESNPEPGTIRHLLRHVLAYSPRRSGFRVIYFENAAAIRDEAESALLKTLEEPPPDTLVILSAEDPGYVKDTVLSRCLQIHLPLETNISEENHDRWKNFWKYASGQYESDLVLFQELEYDIRLKDSYDRLTFTRTDYGILDLALYQNYRKNKKLKQETQIRFMYMALLPLMFSLRDNLVRGNLPAEGPVELDALGIKNSMAAFRLCETYLHQLQFKVFDTRALNTQAIFYVFLGKFIRHWKKD